MIADPPVREDGQCVTCLGPRGAIPKTLVNRTARDLKRALATDPFCSSTCARAYYGTSLPEFGKGPRGKPKPRSKPVTVVVFKHGTEGGYTNGKCRCPDCRTASTEARRGRARTRGKAA